MVSIKATVPMKHMCVCVSSAVDYCGLGMSVGLIWSRPFCHHMSPLIAFQIIAIYCIQHDVHNPSNITFHKLFL